MNTAKRNYIYQVVYQLLALLIPLVTAPYLTRVLGAENLGIYTYTFTVAGVFLKIAELGIITHGSRSIATVQDDPLLRSNIFCNIFAVQASSSAFSIILYILYVIFFVKEDKLIAGIQAIYVLTALFDISWFYMGMENFKKTVLRDTAVKVISVVCIFLFVRSRSDLWVYTLVAAGSALFGFLTLWIGITKHVYYVKPSVKKMKEEFVPILTLFIPTVAVTIYTLMDKVMLGTMSGKSQVAFYQYASALASIPLSFITSFGLVMLPRTSNMVARDDKGINSVINNSLLFMIFMSSAFAFGLAAISSDLIPLYYGNEFLPCITLLILLSVKLPFMAWANTIRSQALIPQHKDKQFIISLFIGAFINLVLNAILIPSHASTGAAIATIVAEASVCIAQTVFTWKQIRPTKTIIKSIGFIIIGIIMLFAVYYIKSISTGTVIFLLIEVICGAGVYLVLSFFYYCLFIKKQKILLGIKDILKFIKK